MSINQAADYLSRPTVTLTLQPAAIPMQRYSTLNLHLLNDKYTSRILAFSGRPSNAEVCKHWYQVSQNSYFLIEQAYFQNAKIRQFMPLAAANSLQAVQQTYHKVMNSTKFKNSTEFLNINCLIEKSPLKALCQTSPLDLHPIVKVVEDANLVRFFDKLASHIRANEMPALDNELNLAQRASVIRTWMMKNNRVTDRIVALDLSDLTLTILPKEIGQLVNLKTLHLCNNQLVTLPKEIGQLVKLETIDLENNQLVTLPEEIGQLVNLKWLNLRNNQLVTLLKEIGQLVNLKGVDLANNQLATLPKEIVQLVNLKILDLANNQLDPEEMVQLVNLQGVQISW
ncbi:MAG: leucine-rich repeat domain-containing protein [Rhabdochlamydiaceae bacterium]|jgi:hypothetical protein